MFLKKYRYPQEIGTPSQLQFWKDSLNAEPVEIFNRFLTENLVEKTDLDLTQQLQYKSSNELKAMAKERGLPHSGTKETLAKRLVKSNPEEIAQMFREKVYFVCSRKGQILVEKFIEAEKFARHYAQDQSLQALKQGRFKDACLAVTTYGNFLKNDSSPDTDSQKHNLDVLQIIFSAHLSRHAQFEENLIFNLRIGAAMMQLWGENDPRPWLECSSDQFDLVVESRMLLFHALEKTRLKQIKDVGIRWVSVLSSRNGDECSICQSDAGKKYSVNSAPILPHEGCTCAKGCGCTIIAEEG